MQPCPRCKTKLPPNATMCIACGMRLNTAAPAPKAEEPASAPVSAKTTFGMMSPIAKPAAQAAKPAAAPVKAAWGMPKPQSKSQPIPTQPQEPAPAAEPVPAKTMFGVGMAVQPAPKAAPQAAPARSAGPVLDALSQSTVEPAPEPVLPKTMFGVGVAAVSAPSAPAYQPPEEPPYQAPPEPQYQAPQYEEPAPQPIQQVAPLSQRTPEPQSIGLAETMPAPEPSAQVPSGAALASIQEKDFLGADVELPRTPSELEGVSAFMPDAPASPAMALLYFFKVLGARVDLLSHARRLEAETKLWQERIGYLLATIGLRSPGGANAAQISALQTKISEQARVQQETMGASGAKLKAFEEREHELNRDIADREGSYATLQSQLKDIEVVRKDLQNKMKQPMPPIELANDLTKTDGPYSNLKTQTEAARVALQDARSKYNSTVKEKKQMLKDVEVQMKASNEQLVLLRAELKQLLQPIGQEALLQGSKAAMSCKGEIEAINQGISARQALSKQLREQIIAVNQKTFLQGAGAFGGVLVLVFLVLYLLRPGA